MTGEMSYISPQGIDSDGDEWALHAELARRLGGTLQPFDKYQGPYIHVRGADLRADSPPYAMPTNLPGTVRLWLSLADDEWSIIVYREDTDTASEPVPPNADLIEAAARALLAD